MALVYRKGIGVPIDPGKSRDYMIKAAQAGDVDSQFYLAHDLIWTAKSKFKVSRLCSS